jgi:hypothetical protein
MKERTVAVVGLGYVGPLSRSLSWPHQSADINKPIEAKGLIERVKSQPLI